MQRGRNKSTAAERKLEMRRRKKRVTTLGMGGKEQGIPLVPDAFNRMISTKDVTRGGASGGGTSTAHVQRQSAEAAPKNAIIESLERGKIPNA